MSLSRKGSEPRNRSLRAQPVGSELTDGWVSLKWKVLDDQLVDQAVEQGITPVAGFHVGLRVALKEIAQYADGLSHLRRTAESWENRVDMQRRFHCKRLPLGRARGQQVVAAAAFAVQLADVLRFGAAELLHGEVGIFAVAGIVVALFAARLAGEFSCLAEAVFVDRLENLVASALA